MDFYLESVVPYREECINFLGNNTRLLQAIYGGEGKKNLGLSPIRALRLIWKIRDGKCSDNVLESVIIRSKQNYPIFITFLLIFSNGLYVRLTAPTPDTYIDLLDTSKENQ